MHDYGNGIRLTKEQYSYIDSLGSGADNDAIFVNSILMCTVGEDELKKCTVARKAKTDKSTQRIEPKIMNFLQGIEIEMF
jgi:hypothetical protein